jgi:hypothetical protein
VALSVAIAAIVLGVAVAVLAWHGEPARTQDAIITAIGADGRIEWDEARFVHAEVDNTIAEPIPDSHYVGQLSDSATFFVPLGETGDGVTVDASGAGASPISRDKFLASGPDVLYAVQLTIKDGRVIKVAEYYHP